VTSVRDRSLRRACLAAIAVLVVVLGASCTPSSRAAGRRVVVVGDSIILGARGPLEASLGRAGWTTSFDAEVSRSTSAGVEAVRHHGLELGDSLVVSLGANDAGNPATFRQRVDALMTAAAGVPHVYWLTIREVRPYYGPANQVLRDATRRYPNLQVVDWHGATAGSSGLTAGDGLHLTPAGARSMAFLVSAAVEAGAPTTVVGPPSTAGPDPVAVAPTPPSPAPAPAPVVTTVPTTVAVSTTSTAVPPTAPRIERAPTSGTAVAEEDGESVLHSLGRSVGVGLVAVVVILAVAGIWIAVWSLLRTRGRAAVPPPAPAPGPVADPGEPSGSPSQS
jgi:lysophospholipase L1-like esterase